MTLGQNGVLRYGPFGEFLEFFGDRMANSGLIDFKLGFNIKVNVSSLSFSPDSCFFSRFYSEASHGQYCTYAPKTTWPSPPTPSSKSSFPT